MNITTDPYDKPYYHDIPKDGVPQKKERLCEICKNPHASHPIEIVSVNIQLITGNVPTHILLFGLCQDCIMWMEDKDPKEILKRLADVE